MGRPVGAGGRVPLNMRVPSELLAWVSSDATAAGVSVSEQARAAMTRGRACLEGRCSHAERSRARGARNDELMAELDSLRMVSTAAPTPATDWGRSVLDEAIAAVYAPEPAPPADPRAHLPAAWRHLDDKGLLRFNICPEHLIDRAECVHDHEDPA